MRINGFCHLPTGNATPFEELNLRDGQKFIGKIIKASGDEALLEMAGRVFRAKIEGDPELETGAVLKFEVKHTTDGRILLKILDNTRDANEASPAEKQAPAVNLQKAIISALTGDGLPATPENIEKLSRLLQNFQNKYQQSPPPQVLTYILANKWQVNPETIIASWLFQDAGLRDLLWNILRRTGSNQAGLSLFTCLLMEMSSRPETVLTKLQTLAGQWEKLLQEAGGARPQGSDSSDQTQAAADGSFRSSLLSDDLKNSAWPARPSPLQNQEPLLRSSNSGGHPEPALKNSGDPNSGHNDVNFKFSKTSVINELKQVISRLNRVFDKGDFSAKIEALMNKNLALTKATLQENSVNGNYNLVPLLVNDSQNLVHEVLIKWREEPAAQKDGSFEQVLQMNIPTENMGEIRLLLRIGKSGVQINFKVKSDSVRKYLLRNLNELKASLVGTELKIKVALERAAELSDPGIAGVDLWI
ncbi:MAG: hypothetical protein GX075_05635 [Firmicutes bacterium]|nr:hypothetical protein [Bacillota bacterium]